MRPDPDTGRQRHRLFPVYREMLLQICVDIPALPDPRTLRMSEIRFFYNGLRESLKKHTSPNNKPRVPNVPRVPKR